MQSCSSTLINLCSHLPIWGKSPCVAIEGCCLNPTPALLSPQKDLCSIGYADEHIVYWGVCCIPNPCTYMSVVKGRDPCKGRQVRSATLSHKYYPISSVATWTMVCSLDKIVNLASFFVARWLPLPLIAICWVFSRAPHHHHHFRFMYSPHFVEHTFKPKFAHPLKTWTPSLQVPN